MWRWVCPSLLHLGDTSKFFVSYFACSRSSFFILLLCTSCFTLILSDFIAWRKRGEVSNTNEKGCKEGNRDYDYMAGSAKRRWGRTLRKVTFILLRSKNNATFETPSGFTKVLTSTSSSSSSPSPPQCFRNGLNCCSQYDMI